jgi:hypothetical protein
VELLNLRWSNVDLFARVIQISRSKTVAGHRTIPLNTDAMEAFALLRQRAEAYGGGASDHYIFPACECEHIDFTRPQTSIRTAWRHLTVAAGLKGFRFHDLRGMAENGSGSLSFESPEEENIRLREENARLRRLLAVHSISIPQLGPDRSPPAKLVETTPLIDKEERTRKRISLFRSLFRGREDVYARRWENADGKSGYMPAAIKDRKAINRSRPDERKKVEQKTRGFLPVTDAVIESHLLGNETVGVYPLLPDETCWFLAADFDKKTWEYDSLAFLATCRELNVPAALERSRSGKGGHIWIFFERSVPTITARKLGCVILTRTMERRHQLGLDSYDRFFPN